MIRTLLKPFSFLPALLLMYMIYTFSAQPADVSSALSYKVSYKMVETVDYVFETNLDPWEVDYWATRLHGATRKIAHMAIYFALAVAVSFPLYVYGIRGIWLMLLAGLICVGFACGDEYHQSMVYGRNASKKDVAIDAFGVFWGIILTRIIGWTGRKTIFRPKKEKHRQEMPQQDYQRYPYPQNPYQQYPYQQSMSSVNNQEELQGYHPYKNAYQPPHYHS